jgi:hypothetical protein
MHHTILSGPHGFDTQVLNKLTTKHSLCFDRLQLTKVTSENKIHTTEDLVLTFSSITLPLVEPLQYLG